MDNKEIEQKARDVVKAWDSLLGGRDYYTHEIQSWLINDMAPAMKALREQLGMGYPGTPIK